MLVSMMDVRVVGVRVGHCLVPVRVAVRLAGRLVGDVFVPVVFVVNVAVVVPQRRGLLDRRGSDGAVDRVPSV